jgi:hypothetical protein
VTDSLILNVAIGLTLTFALFAALVSVLTEATSAFLGLRGDYLLRGLRALVDGQPTPAAQTHPSSGGAKPLSQELLENALIAHAQQEPPSFDNELRRIKQRRQLPAYLSARSFSAAVLDHLIPNADGATDLSAAVAGIQALDDSVPLKRSLLALTKTATGDMDKFRREVEYWYDDHMDRVTGWYKRRVRWISIALGTALVLAFNVNALTIARDLYTDQALRETVVTQAIAHAQCDSTMSGDCINDARKEISDLRGGGLPIGWGIIPECKVKSANCHGAAKYGFANPDRSGWADVWFVLAILAGWLITVIGLVPGSQFWFDLLTRLGSLRSSGPKPARSDASP